MADPDKSLMDRLKALKPATSVNLSGSHPHSKGTTTTSAKPAAKGDTLADRLRGLREQVENTPSPGSTDGPHPPPAVPCDDPVADYDDLLETDDGFLEDLLQSENAEPAVELSLDARAEIDVLRELSRQFSELAKVQDVKDDGDDSGAEDMKRNVEDLVSEAVEGVKKGDGDETNPVETGPDGDPGAKSEDPGGAGNPALSLPSVPTDLPSPTTSPPQDVPNTGDFEDDMARRMAALKNFKPAAQPESDSLNLPSVPTFHPSDKKPKPAERAKPAGRVGFTDDDMETWCTVCLEDGTLICPGCDDDVYCQRCWYEMHRGPSAGYDETLHEAKQFNKDRKKKQVAVGA